MGIFNSMSNEEITRIVLEELNKAGVEYSFRPKRSDAGEKGCEYCESTVTVCSEGKYYTLTDEGWTVDVRFCPMCGRKLYAE